jgi:hypothetical protein
MRTEFVSLFAEINAKHLEELTKEVKETIAHDVDVKIVKPVFTAANLWSIHNRKRSSAGRRNYTS